MEAFFTDEEKDTSCCCVMKKGQEDFLANEEERYFEMHVVTPALYRSHKTNGCLVFRKRT